MAKSKSRNQSGVTIMEMVVASVLMGLTLSVIGELVYLNTYSATKVTNQADALSDARTALDHIASDVRAARAFGDFYAGPANRNQFPGDGNNPLFGAGQAPSGGWPPAPWTGQPYYLSTQCLIVQQPVLFEDPQNDPTSPSYSAAAQINPQNGFPCMIAANSLGPSSPPSDMEDLDTVIYQVVADPNRAGQYLLQVMRLPGQPPTDFSAGSPGTPLISSTRSLINPPQTVLRGIIGPLDPANPGAPPNVFHYYPPYQQGTPPGAIITGSQNPVPSSSVPSLTGVGIDFEIQKPDSSSSNPAAVNPQILPIHGEAFMRSNTNIILTNFSH